MNQDEASVLEIEQNSVLQYNLYSYCLNNPSNIVDQFGFLGEAIVLATAGGAPIVSGGITVGASNFWNPIGWIIIGSTVVVASVSFAIYYYKEHTTTKNGKKKEKHQNGNARCQRDQGGEKKKQKGNWKRPR